MREQSRLRNEHEIPIIFISGRGDIPSTVRAMKAGALEFLTKLLDSPALLDAIRAALLGDVERRRELVELTKLNGRFALLTPREREVLPLVASGMLNKQAAATLGISEVTLQLHRGQIMKRWPPTRLRILSEWRAALLVASLGHHRKLLWKRWHQHR
jgi:FixJ family two-component response regulator